MGKQERRLRRLIAMLGAILTGLVACADLFGLLDGMENSLYDQRARRCQFFTPPPTDRIFHLDIDDPALEAVGNWPWPRATVAEMLDEVCRAGATVVFPDILFTGPQGGEAPPPDADARLAAALDRFDHALVPLSLRFGVPRSDLYLAVKRELTRDLELTPGQVADALRGSFPSADALDADVDRAFVAARADAMYERIVAETDFETATPKVLRTRLLPRTPPHVSASPPLRLLERQHARALSVHALRRLSREAEDGLPPLLTADGELAPVRPLCDAADSVGFVDYLPLGDGVVRSVPLCAKHRGRLVPQAGLALACAALGADPTDPTQLRYEPGRVVIRPPGGSERVIPVSARHTGDAAGTRGLFMEVPWFGGRQWETIYGVGPGAEPHGHLSMNAVWDVCQKQQSLARNCDNADGPLEILLKLVGDEAPPAQVTTGGAAGDSAADAGAARVKLIERVLDDPFTRDMVADYAKLKPEELTESDRANLLAYQSLSRVREANAALRAELEQMRADLRAKMQGRAVVIGFAGTGVSDVVRTSLHPQCPGSVVHGVIFNAVMTGELWRRAPWWVTPLVTLALGLLTTAATAWLSPGKSLAASCLIGVGYLALNGLALFDYGNLIVGAAAPAAAVGLTWSGCSLFRFVYEFSERNRITRRFRSYIDPRLVNYVIENPEKARLEGRVDELTVVFSDLQGFTALSEKLGEKAVPLLAEFMGLMVPVIRRHKGYVNKFLGDGIMFFFNAPEPDADHATNAVAAVLEMHAAMAPFDERLAARGLPPLEMRTGINTGRMVVGDAGPPEASDYTVIGDAVNLAARLESANKYTGTNVLIGSRTAELLGGKYLLRPVGRLKVVGRAELVMTYEPLVAADLASDEQRRAAEHAKRVVDLFQSGRFADCITAVTAVEGGIPATTLCATYLALCQRHLRTPPEDFWGQIELTDK